MELNTHLHKRGDSGSGGDASDGDTEAQQNARQQSGSALGTWQTLSDKRVKKISDRQKAQSKLQQEQKTKLDQHHNRVGILENKQSEHKIQLEQHHSRVGALENAHAETIERIDAVEAGHADVTDRVNGIGRR